MRHFRITSIVGTLIVCGAILGCVKVESNVNINPDDPNSEPVVTSQTTTVFGTVFNKVTHEPVIGAEVEIGQNWGYSHSQYYGSSACHKITSSISGSDGQFELHFGELDFYEDFYIATSCYGYENYYSKVIIGEGSECRIDVNLEPN